MHTVVVTSEDLGHFRAEVRAGRLTWPELRDALLDAGLADDAAMRADMLRRRGWEWWESRSVIDSVYYLGEPSDPAMAPGAVHVPACRSPCFWSCWEGWNWIVRPTRCASLSDGQRLTEQWLLGHGY